MKQRAGKQVNAPFVIEKIVLHEMRMQQSLLSQQQHGRLQSARRQHKCQRKRALESKEEEGSRCRRGRQQV